MLIAEAIERFPSSLAARNPHTATAYVSGVRLFAQFLEESGVDITTEPCTTLDYPHIEDFLTWLVKRHGKDRWQSTLIYFGGLAAFLRFLARRRQLDPLLHPEVAIKEARLIMGKPTYKMRQVDPRVPHLVLHVRNLRLPPEGQVRRLVVLRDKALVEVLFCTAMRVAEVASLPRDLLERDDIIINGKGNKERVVYLDADARTAIAAYLAARTDSFPLLFLNFDRNHGRHVQDGRLSGMGIWQRVKKYAAEVGISDLHPHDFRHAKARALLNHGCPLDMVQDILGHSSPETTKRIYAQYTRKVVRAAFEHYSQTAAELAADLAPMEVPA
jgi:site-specific recombinase XerD